MHDGCGSDRRRICFVFDFMKRRKEERVVKLLDIRISVRDDFVVFIQFNFNDISANWGELES